MKIMRQSAESQARREKMIEALLQRFEDNYPVNLT